MLQDRRQASLIDHPTEPRLEMQDEIIYVQRMAHVGEDRRHLCRLGPTDKSLFYTWGPEGGAQGIELFLQRRHLRYLILHGREDILV